MTIGTLIQPIKYGDLFYALGSILITSAFIYTMYYVIKPCKHLWKSFIERKTKMNLLWLHTLDTIAGKKDINLEALYKAYTKNDNDLRIQNWSQVFETKLRDQVHEEFFNEKNPYKE